LKWSALEGGTYEVQSTTNIANSSWTTLSSSVSPNETTGGHTNVTSASANFYRVGRTAVTTYDGAGTTVVASETGVAPGGNANPGQNLFLTITLPTSPPNPPLNAPTVPTVTLSNTTTTVTISGEDISRTATNIVTVIIPIPSNAPNATNNVIVNFNGMPTYTLTGGFIIN
jgi:hypothetical protein